jgi:hypothetical protein
MAPNSIPQNIVAGLGIRWFRAMSLAGEGFACSVRAIVAELRSEPILGRVARGAACSYIPAWVIDGVAGERLKQSKAESRVEVPLAGASWQVVSCNAFHPVTIVNPC